MGGAVSYERVTPVHALAPTGDWSHSFRTYADGSSVSKLDALKYLNKMSKVSKLVALKYVN